MQSDSCQIAFETRTESVRFKPDRCSRGFKNYRINSRASSRINSGQFCFWLKIYIIKRYV